MQSSINGSVSGRRRGTSTRRSTHLRTWRRIRPSFATFGAEAGALADKHDYPHAAALFTGRAVALRRRLAVRRCLARVPRGAHVGECRPIGSGTAAVRIGPRTPPRYAAAAGHLAHLLAAFGDPEGLERARLLLEPLVRRTDDPEYVGQLGTLYRQMHRTDEGDRLVRTGHGGIRDALGPTPGRLLRPRRAILSSRRRRPDGRAGWRGKTSPSARRPTRAIW